MPSSPVEVPSSPVEVPLPPRPAGPVVGSLPLKWQTYSVDYEYSASTTVLHLKAWLQSVTSVPVDRQKLIGWAPKQKKLAEADGTRLADLQLGPRTSRLVLMGTPARDAASAESDLERGKRTSRFIANDLRGRRRCPPRPPPKRCCLAATTAAPFMPTTV